MFQYQPQEVFPWQGSRLFFAGFTVEVKEDHLSPFAGQDVVVADHAPVQIPG